MSEHYTEFKKNIEKRNEHKEKAQQKRNKRKLPVIGALDEWLAKRHELKAEKHESKAFEHAEKHADELAKKHK